MGKWVRESLFFVYILQNKTEIGLNKARRRGTKTRREEQQSSLTIGKFESKNEESKQTSNSNERKSKNENGAW